MKRFLFNVAVAALAVLGASQMNPAGAGVIVYSGLDVGAGSANPRPNSNAAAASFDTAAGALGTNTLYTFESTALGSFSTVNLGGGVSMTSATNTGSVVNAPVGTPDQLYGYNTTAGGSHFVSLLAGSLTFNFTPGIEGFGSYISGVQLDSETITFFDGSTETVNVPNPGLGNGGIAFVGFTDAGQSIASVTLNFNVPSGGDIVGIDDVRVLRGGDTVVTPEPASLTLLGLGVAGLAGYGWRRRKTA